MRERNNNNNSNNNNNRGYLKLLYKVIVRGNYN